MEEQIVQGPLSGVKGRSEGSQPKEGTTAPADSTPKTEGTPTTQDTTEGRAEPEGTSKKTQAPKSAAEEKFLEEFDPTTLPEELKPAYQKLDKDFRAAFTKKTQAISKQKEKIDAYDAFMANPKENIMRAAQQYGLDVKPAGGNQTPSQQGKFSQDWQPNTWDEVYQKFSEPLLSTIEQRIEQKFMGRLQPIFENIQQMTSKNIEAQLSEIDANWKNYEEEMTETLKLHPTLAKDVAKLYRISVPEEVLKSKYTQAALKKFEDKASSARVQGKSSVQSSQAPTDKKMTFQESVEYAKRKLREQER